MRLWQSCTVLHSSWTPRKTAASLLLAVVSSAPLVAQYGGSGAPSIADGLARTRQLVEMQVAHPELADRKRLIAEKRKLEFSGRLTEFTNSWNSLMESKSHGKWNPKRAKAARKAFERLVRTPGWLEEPK